MRVGINYPHDGGKSMVQDLRALNAQNKMAKTAYKAKFSNGCDVLSRYCNITAFVLQYMVI